MRTFQQEVFYMKKKPSFENIIVIGIAVFIVVAIILNYLGIMVQNQTGVDIYVAPPAIKAFWNNAYDYMRIQSEKSTYSIGETITLDASCGFYLPSEGRSASILSFDVACCDYLDVSFSNGTLEEYPGTEEDFYENCYGYIARSRCNLYHMKAESFDASQLILKEGFFGQINKDSLQYHFTVTLQVKPDAPESFSGTLYIRVYDYCYGNSYITLHFQKEGNTIMLLPN